ncbi:ABC transporter ATP-binding protein [Intrasporangium sp.]|uniref:ABC transporter ATP-binding protein n=1 Tax=Intrasporangium sp. TaxID=1925024 RepID=UPI002939D4FA|nr:ABC transporter ATP-binding protein [Intrasporangium sp.]MDV3223007.1 ABC transporter ATP-binding protein [Intrasporangium sp.]
MSAAASTPASTPATAEAGLRVEGLRAAYDRLQVLHDVDITVHRGELVAVVGANGAGKSTLLRSVSGLLRPTAGTVTLNGADVTRLGAEQIAARGLTHVPENRLVFPSLTVEDNLALGGWVRMRDKGYAARRAAALELFPRLADRITLPAGALSGGEQQMLAMARALMAEPSVIVLDEPSLGLAPKVVGEIVAALAHLRDDRGLAVLLVEQNVRAAFLVADRVVVMDRGEVVAEGTPAELAKDDRVRRAYLGGGTTSSSAILDVIEPKTKEQQ